MWRLGDLDKLCLFSVETMFSLAIYTSLILWKEQ